MKQVSVLVVTVCLLLVGTLTHDGTATASGYPWGDVNCSTTADSVDAALVLQYDAGLVVLMGCFHLGDVNADGAKNAIDAALILQYEAGLIDSLVPPPFDFGPPAGTG